MILFFAEECDGENAKLLESEALHCKQALRKKEGDVLAITDGKGNAYKAEISSIGKKVVELNILEKIDLGGHRKYHLHVAIAPTKNISRFEWFLEKATELGIDEITPILCQRSERKVIKNERLNKILISAMKQSLKTKAPKLNPLTRLKDFLPQAKTEEKYIAHLENEDTKLLVHRYNPAKDVTILIGPEGDFSLEEIKSAIAEGFDAVSLGDYRLRTETAGISAVQAIHFCNQR